jgi:hypothetical protein
MSFLSFFYIPNNIQIREPKNWHSYSLQGT